MIPSTWRPFHRDSDDELVGYLAEDGTPVNLVGVPIGDADHAETVLTANGLASLDGRWICRLPDPLPRGATDAGAPDAGWPWRHVLIVETSPRECRIQPAAGYPDEVHSRATLPVPVGDLLRREE